MIDMSLNNIVIGLTVIVSLLAFNNRELWSKMLLNPYQVIHRKQYYRLLTHAFIHADFVHLFFNMFVLYSFGQAIELVLTQEEYFNSVLPEFQFWGTSMGYLIYVLIYLGGILFSVIPSLQKHKDNPGYNSLGASGAVSAVVMVFILILPTVDLHLLFIPIGIPGFIFGALYLYYEYYMSKRGGTGIAHDAHLLGGIYGVVLMLILEPSLGTRFVEQIAGFIGQYI